MLESSELTKDLYINMNNAIKLANAGYNDVRSTDPFIKRLFRFLVRKISSIKRLKIFDKELNKFSDIPINKEPITNVISSACNNFYSNHRIAIYTSVFGKYDNIQEPLVEPDNCDYYIITDLEVKPSSKWSPKNIKEFEHLTKNMNVIEKNRFFKMHPHLLFPDYTYSIYIDGNIQVMSDLTEFIYYIGKSGIAVHKHRERDCVYEEAREIIKLNRDSVQNIVKHIKYIAETNMPRNYGLFECGILVREHHHPTCKKTMEDWWSEFNQYSNRDQLAFAHTLFLNQLNLNDLGLLGNNIFENYAFKFHRHR